MIDENSQNNSYLNVVFLANKYGFIYFSNEMHK